MRIHLVRHARAVPRISWDASLEGEEWTPSPPRPDPSPPRPDLESDPQDLLRPLSETGREQSEALADQLEGESPMRLLAGPALRCQQTLEPLALALGLPIEVDERLAESEAATGLDEVIADLGDVPAVLCTHGGSIRSFFDRLGLDPERDAGIPACRKGSIWTLESSRAKQIERAAYVEPRPATRSRRKRSKLRLEMVWPSSLRVAVLDMGSTSFTLLIADVTRDGTVRPVVREKVMLRLGTAIAQHGKIPSALARQAVEVAVAMRRVAIPEKAERFLAVATASLRDARNGRKIAEKIERAIDVPVQILEGEAEARLMFRAFQERLSLGPAHVIGLDLGGGSLELAVGSGDRIDRECTLSLGVVRLHRELVTGDPMRSRDAKRIRERVQRELAPHRDALRASSADQIVAAGGTPRAIARLVAAARGEGSAGDSLPIEIGHEELRAITKRLVRSTHDERLTMPGIRRRRADLLATGALILVSVAETLGLERFTFCDWGLREGLMLDLIEKTGPRVVADARASGRS